METAEDRINCLLENKWKEYFGICTHIEMQFSGPSRDGWGVMTLTVFKDRKGLIPTLSPARKALVVKFFDVCGAAPSAAGFLAEKNPNAQVAVERDLRELICSLGGTIASCVSSGA
jgi:hypothetical protein